MSESGSDWQNRAKRVMTAKDEGEVRDGYDAWAAQYDQDHVNFGLLLLAHFTGMFCRHITPDTRPILDAGAGTGRLGHALHLHGYDNFVGIDLSPGMLEVARSKPGYSKTLVQRLGSPLDFDDDTFPAVASLGAFAPNLAGGDAFEELIRVTRPGGVLVLSMRAGMESETGFIQHRQALEQRRLWQYLDGIEDFISHPELDPAMRYSICVYRKN